MPDGIRIQKTCLYYPVCVSRTVHNLVPKKQTAKERQSLGQPDQSLLYMRFRQSWQSRLKVESEKDDLQRLEWSKQVMIFRPLAPPATPLQVKSVSMTHHWVSLWCWHPNTRTTFRIIQLTKTSDMVRGSGSPEAFGMGNSSQKDCRLCLQDWNDGLNMAWESRRRISYLRSDR